jgi:hypothetical protein
VSSADVAASLSMMAEDYEKQAEAAEGREPAPQPVPPPAPQS